MEDVKTEPLITVIIPVYNIADYLEKCILSILNQKYTNLEIILVDDGSSDGSGEICSAYALEDQRVSVIHKTNGGLSSARNAGLDASNGEFIVFVDGDDYIASDMISRLYDRLTSDASDLAICAFEYVDKNGDKTRADLSAYCPLKDEVLQKEDLFPLMNISIPGYWFYTVACSKLYRRSLFTGVRYPEGRLYEDEYMIHHIFEKVETASVIEDKLYMYTQREGSIMNSSDADPLRRMDVIYALKDRLLFLKEKGYKKSAADAAANLYIIWLKMFAVFSLADFQKCAGEVIASAFDMIRIKNIRGVKLLVQYGKTFAKILIKDLIG